MDPCCELAKNAVNNFIKNNKIISEGFLPEELKNQKAGVFVSIYSKKDNKLKGCIGTFLPIEDNIKKEIINNAISAAIKDDRFEPIQKKELSNLIFSVDILSQPSAIKNLSELDTKKFGIIVKTDDGRTGLLLPDLEGINKVEHQIAIACQKAGINPNEESIGIYKFTVERHQESL